MTAGQRAGSAGMLRRRGRRCRRQVLPAGDGAGRSPAGQCRESPVPGPAGCGGAAAGCPRRPEEEVGPSLKATGICVLPPAGLLEPALDARGRSRPPRTSPRRRGETRVSLPPRENPREFPLCGEAGWVGLAGTLVPRRGGRVPPRSSRRAGLGAMRDAPAAAAGPRAGPGAARPGRATRVTALAATQLRAVVWGCQALPQPPGWGSSVNFGFKKLLSAVSTPAPFHAALVEVSGYVQRSGHGHVPTLLLSLGQD